MDEENEKEVTHFSDLGLNSKTLAHLGKIGYEHPTPIQAAFIPIALTGRDCTGQARTGTGKTAAFVLPCLEKIERSGKKPQALVLSPTRELSEQVAEEARRLAAGNEALEIASLVGGRPLDRQMRDLKKGCHIAVGTPGRVIDLLRRKALDLSELKLVILDEADRMLDIGFRPDIERILKDCPKERQTLLLSATMNDDVERIAKRFMNSPDRVDLSCDQVVADSVEQFYCTVDIDRKLSLLVRLLASEKPQQAIVFCRTKRGADFLYKKFAKKLKDVEALHGDMHQSKRDRVMKKFRSGQVRLLIATDVVGRGIDVSGISHIVNYNVPEFCDDYVHRIGRAGRMSSDQKGRAFTFITKDEGSQLTNIEMRINTLLQEYQLPDYEAYQSRGRRKHVDDDKRPEIERQEFNV